MTGCADSEVFRKRLLHEAGVAVLADIHFGRRVPGDGQHIRFSYAASQRGDRARASSASTRSSAAPDARRAMATSLDEQRDGARRPFSRACAAALGKTAIARRPRARRRGATSPRTRTARGRRCRPTSSTRFIAARAPTWRAPSSASPSRAKIPPAVARYLDALDLPPALAAQKSQRGVCWPEFADLDWAGAGLVDRAAADARATIASASPALLRDRRDRHARDRERAPDADRDDAAARHARRRRASRERIVSGMEEAFALVRARARAHAARGQPHFRALAHRRHRADDRPRRARAVPRAHPAARLGTAVAPRSPATTRASIGSITTLA